MTFPAKSYLAGVSSIVIILFILSETLRFIFRQNEQNLQNDFEAS